MLHNINKNIICNQVHFISFDNGDPVLHVGFILLHAFIIINSNQFF